MISDLCERGACETCFEDELDGCGHECHGPLDGAAGGSTGACRAQDPADGLPRTVRAARATVPGRPSSSGPPLEGEGGKTSPRLRERADAAETPGPETAAAPPLLGRPAVRAGAQTPAPATRATHLDRALVQDRAPDNTPARGGRRRAAGAPRAGTNPIAAAMSEAELEEHVRELCKGLSIVRIHVYNSRGTTPGVPDDILVGPRGILWRELKTMRGKVTPAQQAMGQALLDAGQDWGVWRPDALLSGEIAEQLAGLAGLRAGAA